MIKLRHKALLRHICCCNNHLLSTNQYVKTFHSCVANQYKITIISHSSSSLSSSSTTIANTFFDSFIWQHCKTFIKTSPSTEDNPALMNRFNMVFSVIRSCIHIASETKQSYKDGKWLQQYQQLFSELNNSNEHNLWRRELQRLSSISETEIHSFRNEVDEILKLLSFQSVPVIVTTAGKQQIMNVDGSIVSKFANIIMNSEMFVDVDYENVLFQCEELIQTINKQKSESLLDYYLIQIIAQALIREQQLLNSIEKLPVVEEEWNEKPELMEEVNRIKASLAHYIAEEPMIPLYYTTRKRLMAKIPHNTTEQSEGILVDCNILINDLKQTKDLDALSDRAIALIELKRYSESEQDCFAALRINPCRADLVFRITAMDFIRGDYLNGLLLMTDAIHAAQVASRNMNLEHLGYYKTECISLCREGIQDNVLYQIVLTLIECRMLLVCPPTESLEELDNLFKSLMKICNQKVQKFYVQNKELQCAIEILYTSYAVQVLMDTRGVVERLDRIVTLLPYNPAVWEFVGVTYFQLFQMIYEKNQSDAYDTTYLERSMDSLTRSLQISHYECMPQFRYEPYRAVASLSAITAYLEEKTDQDRINMCTDALKKLETFPNHLMIPKLLMYRASFYERFGSLIQALVDLDRVLQLHPFNIPALKKRRDILRQLKLRPDTMLEDDTIIMNLMSSDFH
jgi:tetratricopeptide (TPR) repeat protein